MINNEPQSFHVTLYLSFCLKEIRYMMSKLVFCSHVILSCYAISGISATYCFKSVNIQNRTPVVSLFSIYESDCPFGICYSSCMPFCVSLIRLSVVSLTHMTRLCASTSRHFVIVVNFCILVFYLCSVYVSFCASLLHSCLLVILITRKAAQKEKTVLLVS